MLDELTGDQADEIERLKELGSRVRGLGQNGASPALRKVCIAILGEQKEMIHKVKEDG